MAFNSDDFNIKALDHEPKEGRSRTMLMLDFYSSRSILNVVALVFHLLHDSRVVNAYT